jgi:hypothetical protein
MTKAKKCPDRKVYKHIGNDWDKVSIVLVEEIEREKLRECEDKHVRAVLDDPLCLNCRPVILTDDEKRQYKREQKKKNYERHKEKYAEYKAKWFQSLPEEEHARRSEYQKNYYAALTPEQKAERVARNRERRRQKIQ